MKDPESETLEVLSMHPEPFGMLVGMIELESGSQPSPEAVADSLRELQERGYIYSEKGIGTDQEGNLVEDIWLAITDEGRAAAVSQRSYPPG
jgi:hypothetical protein